MTPKAAAPQHYAFISYARDDLEMVEPIVNLLTQMQADVWFDKRDIRHGDEWVKVASEALDRASVVFFFASDNSIKSKYVNRELQMAERENIAIAPIYLHDNLKLPPALNFIAGSRDFIEKDKFKTSRALAEEIKRNHPDIFNDGHGANLVIASIVSDAISQELAKLAEGYVYRPDKIEEIDRVFESGSNVCFLTGMPGSGKSSLALEYGTQHANKTHGKTFPATVPHGHEDCTLDSVLEAIFDEFAHTESDMSNGNDSTCTSSSNDLIIIDSINSFHQDPDLSLNYIKNHLDGRLLVLTQLPRDVILSSYMSAERCIVDLSYDSKPDEAALTFLRTLFRRSAREGDTGLLTDEDVDAVTERLAYHPLAIVIAGKTFKELPGRTKKEAFIQHVKSNGFAGILNSEIEVAIPKGSTTGKQRENTLRGTPRNIFLGSFPHLANYANPSACEQQVLQLLSLAKNEWIETEEICRLISGYETCREVKTTLDSLVKLRLIQSRSYKGTEAVSLHATVAETLADKGDAGGASVIHHRSKTEGFWSHIARNGLISGQQDEDYRHSLWRISSSQPINNKLNDYFRADIYRDLVEKCKRESPKGQVGNLQEWFAPPYKISQLYDEIPDTDAFFVLLENEERFSYRLLFGDGSEVIVTEERKRSDCPKCGNYFQGDLTKEPEVHYSNNRFDASEWNKFEILRYFPTSTRNESAKITLPRYTTKIGKAAFRGRSRLESVEIPSSVKEIGSGAFRDCVALKNIEIPEQVTEIASSTFRGCRFLESIKLHSKIEGLGEAAFWGCEALKTIELPPDLKSISHSLFHNCRELTNVKLPQELRSIGNSAFKGCAKLKLENGIPDSVTSIGDSAFWDCSCLQGVTLPSSLTELGDSAFRGCTSIEEITIPRGIEHIGEWLFRGCVRLSAVEFSKHVTSIGSRAFQGCQSLERIGTLKKVETIGKYAFEGCSALSDIGKLPSLIRLENHAFQGCYSLKKVDIQSKKNNFIGKWAFEGCASLGSVTLPQNVTTIHDSAFRDCRSLSSIELPTNIESIEPWAFAGCSALTSVSIPDGTRSIGERAFHGCSSLASIEIPKSVRNLGGNAFWCCSELYEVSYGGTRRQWDELTARGDTDLPKTVRVCF